MLASIGPSSVGIFNRKPIGSIGNQSSHLNKISLHFRPPTTQHHHNKGEDQQSSTTEQTICLRQRHYLLNLIVSLLLISLILLFIGFVSNYEYSYLLVVVGCIGLGFWVVIVVVRWVVIGSRNSVGGCSCIQCAAVDRDGNITGGEGVGDVEEMGIGSGSGDGGKDEGKPITDNNDDIITLEDDERKQERKLLKDSSKELQQYTPSIGSGVGAGAGGKNKQQEESTHTTKLSTT